MTERDARRDPDPRHEPGATRETPHERDTRRLGEMLEETRVAMPGVQVLFAFLLAVPFQQRFDEINRLERTAYVVALLSAALATVAFVTPSAFHRVRFRKRDKAYLVELGNRLIIAGLVLLAVAMTSAILLVTSFILDAPAPAIIVGTIATAFFVLWFGIGIARGLDDQAPDTD